MELSEKPNFDGVRNQPLFAIELKEELDLPRLTPLFDVPDQAQSRPSSAPVPRLHGSPSISSRDHEPTPEEYQLNSELKSKCPLCGKGFKTIKAMHGHKRIHGDRGLKGTKKRLETTADFKSYADRVPSNSWGSMKRKRVWKQVIDKNSPKAVAAALILMEMSRSKTMESNPLDEKKNACENYNWNFPSDQTLVEHRSSHKKTGEVQKSSRRKRKVKSESGSHVCEICNKSYTTGQQLGGHKRAHQKDLTPISEVPNCQAALDS